MFQLLRAEVEMNEFPKNKKGVAAAFWGTLFIGFGIGLLLHNMNIIKLSDFDFSNLWPLALVSIGICFFKLPNIIKMIFSGLTAVIITLSIFSLIFSFNFHIGDFKNHSRHYNKKTHYTIYNKPEVKNSNLAINANAFDIDLSSTDTAFIHLMQFFPFDFYQRLKVDSTYSNIEIDYNKGISRKYSRDLEVFLNKTTLWRITSNLNACDFLADFTDINTNYIYFNSAASNIELTLPSNQEFIEIIIESDASNIDLKIPNDVSCEVFTNTTLSNANFEDFEEVSSGHYKTFSVSKSTKSIKISLSGSVSNFDIERYD